MNQPVRTAYTHGHHESVLRAHRWRTVENSAAYLTPHLRPGASLLDVGCGPGTITADFASRLRPGTVIGIDASTEIVATARRDYPDVAFAVGDVHNLQFQGASWDIVHAHQLLQHLVDPVAALKEMRRVVKPGGIVAARDADYGSFTWYPADRRLDEWLDLYHRIAYANGGEPRAGRHLLSWALKAGFAHVAPSASCWCFATSEERSWWGGLWAERITASAIAEQVLREGLASEKQLHAIADAWRTWAAAEDGWLAMLHGEIICTR